MRVSTQKLTVLPVIVGYLIILCAATDYAPHLCEHYDVNTLRNMRKHGLCPPSEYRGRCSLCSLYPDVADCLVPQFHCALNSRCIPRRRVCNGFPDCSDGSDEWGCKASSDFPDTATRHLELVEATSRYITTDSTIFRGNQEKTTNMIRPEDDTSSPPTTSRMLLYTEFNTALSSSSTVIPDFEPNTALSSSTTTISPNSESNTDLSSTATDPMFSHFEWNTTLPSSTIATTTTIPDSELNTALISSSTTKMVTPDSELNTALPLSSSTTEMMTPDSELNTALPLSSSIANIMTPDSKSNTTLPLSSSTTTKMTYNSDSNTNPATSVTKIITLSSSPEETFSRKNAFPETSAMEKCPDNYCMHNAECTVVQGKYHCRCPSSFGELCEIKLGTARVFYEYTVVIAISMTLTILCLVVISICIYRYKRLSWKFSDKTTRTLSQLTLTSIDVA